MAKKSTGHVLITIIGFCAFVALMCSGFSWLLSLINSNLGFLGTLEKIAGIVLSVCAALAGWFWISSSSMNKTLKLVLEIFFVIFAILAILGHCGVHF
ncbi:MAG: hypothetical protein ACI35W_01120 [Anaeroplasmataceae bacterium]